MQRTLHFKPTHYLLPAVLIAVFLLMLPPPVPAEETISPIPYRRTINLTGFTRAKQEMVVSSEVSGRCLAVYADVGEQIPESGKFAQLDDIFVRLDIKANSLEQRKIERQLATERKTLARFTRLREQKSTTQAELDKVELSADLHEISLQNLQNKRTRLDETLKRHTIIAPSRWYIMERMMEPGETVQSGRMVARLGDFEQLVIPFALSFKELQALKQASPLTVQLPELDARVPARIHSISPGFDPKTRKIPLELVIDSNHPDLPQPIRGGIRAELSLTIQGEKNTFVLPLSAVIDRYDAHWVVRENNQRLQVLFLGTTDDDGAVIVSPELTVEDNVLKSIPPDF